MKITHNTDMKITHNTEVTVREQLIEIQSKIVNILAFLSSDTEETETIEVSSFSKDLSLEKKYVYGLKGLASILGCSKSHAQNIKNSGILDKAIIQNGRKIIVDVEMAITLFQKRYE